LGTAAIVEAVAARKFDCPFVIDPVMVGKHGGLLIDPDARAALIRLLFPKAALVMPNLDEVRELTGMEVRNIEQMKEAAKRVADLGPSSVLVKGGHLEGPEAVDLLWHAGEFLEGRRSLEFRGLWRCRIQPSLYSAAQGTVQRSENPDP